ncbi:MAG: hypothetical protein ABIA75_08825 [Candidatus Neomarinimicrobiota bacterium]
MRSFIGFPKEIISKYVTPPHLPEGTEPGELKKESLTFTHIGDYHRIVTISEPFISALVQLCLNSISGYGTPDYPETMKNAINYRLKQSLLGIKSGE